MNLEFNEKKHTPYRMCIVCRRKIAQKELIRLQCKNGDIMMFSGEGRSFYVCEVCLHNKKLINYISKKCKISKEKAKKFFILNFTL